MARAKSTSTATIGFEATLWLAADKLRNNMENRLFQRLLLVDRGVPGAPSRRFLQLGLHRDPFPLIPNRVSVETRDAHHDLLKSDPHHH